jgi:tetratricopeptide (TPR) repeat protein
MTTPVPVEEMLALAVRLVNANDLERARLLCEHADAVHPPHPGVRQMRAVLALRRGEAREALEFAQASLALHPDHLPALLVAADAAGAITDAGAETALLERIVAVDPGRADAWFRLALRRQDAADFVGAADALHQVLHLDPKRADAELNLGIVLQDMGRFDEAFRAYGRAFQLRDDTFGRIAHALATPNVGRLWLDLNDLRAALRAAPD